MNNARIPPIKSDSELEKIILEESMPLIFEGRISKFNFELNHIITF